MESKLLKIKWFFPFVCSLLGFILFSTLIFKWNIHPSHRNKIEPQRIPKFVESKLRVSSTSSINQIPRLAYLVSGSVGDGESIKRMLKAIYHPRNYYILHLDLASTASERLDLRLFVNREKIFSEMGNVHVIVKSNLVTYMGPTMVANTLHAASILLNSGEWDWFINLSASDYPLVTQDDLLHTLSSLPRNLNFIDHTSDMGWKEYHRAKPIIVDPGLYLTKKSDLFWVDEKRKLPSAFRLFTGSAWMMLSRPFIEFCLWGWDNLPRNVLMYYSNFVSSPEGYFHTVICNSQEFRNTTVNHDLHFITWDNPPKQHPHFLTVKEFPKMVESNAPFARKFIRDDPVLDKIDSGLLSRSHHGFALGAWNDVKEDTNNSSIQFVGNISALSPGPGAKRLERLIKSLVSKDGFAKKHCL